MRQAGDVLVGLDALRLLKGRNYLVFLLSSILICIPLAFYYSFTNAFLNEMGVVNAAGKMTMGQMSEFFFMLVMPAWAMAAWALGRIGTPEEVASVITWLLSDSAGWVTGQVIGIDGGLGTIRGKASP